MTFEPYAARTHEKMKEVLMDPSASGPAIHYYMIRGGSKKRNITVWESGTVGSEYIKTYGHYHVGNNLPEIYWILAGEGAVILQKLVQENGAMQADRVADFKVVPVKSGDKVEIPGDYGHLALNWGKQWFVTEDDSPVATGGDSASMPVHANYELVKQMQGFAYYAVEKDGKPALVRNPKYKEIQKEDLGGLQVISV